MTRVFAVCSAFGLVLVIGGTANADTATFPGGSLTTTDLTVWGGYNSQSYDVDGKGFNVDAGPVTIEFKGVNLGLINYTGDMGWPPDQTDTGASVIVGLGNSSGQFVQYGVKSNMANGKGSWNNQTAKYTNDDGYRSYLFQGQYTGNFIETVGNSQYNAEKHGGLTGTDNDCDTFDIKMQIEKVADNTYAVTAWHNLWKSSAIVEDCTWDWNPAKNAIDPAKQGYVMAYEGTWTADGGLDLSNVKPYLAIQNWGTVQPELHTFDWDSVVVTGTLVPEPASLALLALGSLPMLRRRRP
jgi:hypothetical protein